MILQNALSPRRWQSCLPLIVLVATITNGLIYTVPAYSQTQRVQQATPAELGYIDANGRVFKTFNQNLGVIQSRPAPVIKPGTKRPETLKVLARNDNDISANAAFSYKKLTTVKVPPRMRAMHQASLKLLMVFRDTHAERARVTRLGDTKKIAASEQKMAQQIGNAQQNLLKVTDDTLQRLGID